MNARCLDCGGPRTGERARCAACLMRLGLTEVLASEAAAEASAGTLEAETRLGDSVGPYVLEGVLGQGGMGVVYLARQAEPIERRVALKVIKIGMDSREVLARFDVERRTLSLLDHPNIARVLDAGATPGGRPYFVMEFVDGVPVTDYCDAACLGVDRRLDLFLRICEAVQHAHLKGIIHRDLKPSNILVTEVDGRPLPKVIDFGLAKATRQRLAERTAFSRLGRLIGTPEYMSPEQAGRLDGDVDTRTDIYSLGIVMYEMLAGAPPVDPAKLREAGLDGLLRQIRESPSPRPSVRVSSLGEVGADIARKRGTDPSALTRRLAGDLDWVVMKAIEKDRDRRYATVLELAADLRRYLDHEPVSAGPPRLSYRVGKFVRRHRLGVTAAAAIVSALILGVAGTSTGWLRSLRAERRAVEAEAEARKETEVAQQVSDFLVDLFRATGPGSVPAAEVTAPELLARGAERIHEELAGQPLVQARLMLTIGTVYQNLDLYDESLALVREALVIRERVLPPDHLDRSHALHRLGLLLVEMGRFDEAADAIAAGAAIHDRTLAPEDPRRIPILISLGSLQVARGRFVEAEVTTRRTLDLSIGEYGPDSPEVSSAEQSLGTVLTALGRLDEAEALLVRAAEAARRVRGDDHVSYTVAARRLATLYQKQHRLEEAKQLYRRILEVQEHNFGPIHHEVADTLQSLAVCHAILGNYEAAAPLFERALRIKEELFGADHVAVGRMLVNVGNIQRDLGDYTAAEQAYRRSMAILEHTMGDSEDLALAAGNLAGLQARRDRHAEALELHRRALRMRRQVFGVDHPRVAMSLDNVAASLRDLGRLDEAEPMFLEALAIREARLPAGHPLIGKSLHNLGVLYREQGRDAEAVESLGRAIGLREESLGADHPRLASSLSALAVLHRDRGRAAEAEALFSRALAIMEAKYEAGHPELHAMIEEYAVLLRSTGRDDEAVRLETRAGSPAGS